MRRLALTIPLLSLLAGCGGSSGDTDDTSDNGPAVLITTSTTTGGDISPLHKQVAQNGTASFTITPDTGFRIQEVSGCDGLLTGDTYVIANIAKSCTVSASFTVTLSPPKELAVKAADTELLLSWQNVDEASRYNLYFDTQPNIDPATYAANGSGRLILNVTSPYTLTNLVNGTAYYAVVTAIVDDAESPPSNEIGVVPEAPFVPLGGLNDTGIDWCTDGLSNNLECPVAGSEGQDGEHGRDQLARQETLTKTGSGAVGFDFTKIDANGNALPIDANDWTCVRDNVTGLIWEVKTEDEGLRHKDWAYRRYQLDAYIDAVNGETLCGADDWRLPKRHELLSIVHNGAEEPMIDTGHFPRLSKAEEAVFSYGYRYWTADVAPLFSTHEASWYVSLSYGTVLPVEASAPLTIMLVRNGSSSGAEPDFNDGSCSDSTRHHRPFSSPSKDFSVHNNGTATHQSTGLMWMQCAIGQTWDLEAGCQGDAISLTWQAALQAGQINAFAGYDDWRLPNKNELASIVEERCAWPSLNADIFAPPTSTGAPTDFWSSTPVTNYPDRRWSVEFNLGAITRSAAESPKQMVRLVRDVSGTAP